MSLASVLAALSIASPPAFAQAIRLNAPLPPGGDAWGFEVAPDGQHVVYAAEQNVDEVVELFSVVPGPNPAPIRVSGDLVPGGGVSPAYSFHISPDSARVVYQAHQDSVDAEELYSAPIDGSAPAVKLNGPLGPNGNVTRAWISPDSRRVVYRADPTVDERFELFSVPIDGSAAPVRLSTDPVAGGSVYDASVSPDGARVVYRADRDVDEQFELYSVPIDGSAAPVELNGALPAGGNVFAFRFRPDSAAVVYTARQDAADRMDVYVVPSDGSVAAVRVSGPTAADTRVTSVAFTSDGLRVLYVVDPARRLYTAPADASAPAAPVSGTAAVDPYQDLVFSADGQHVLYIAWSAARWGLFTAPVDASAPAVRLTTSQDVDSVLNPPFLMGPTGRAAFLAYELGRPALFSVPIDGSASPVRLTPPELQALRFTLTADGLKAVLHGTVGGSTVALYAAPLDGSGPRLLAGDPRGNVGDIALVPGGDRIVFKGGTFVDSIPDQLYLTWLRPELVPRARLR